MIKFMLTIGLTLSGLAGLAGLVRLNEITQSVRTKQVITREAECKEFLCSTDEQFNLAIDWLESHGYSGIAADKVAVNVWKVYGYTEPDNLDDPRLRPVGE
jgi:hypothetical protein